MSTTGSYTASGAMKGAAAGAAAGSVVPGIGTVVGAVIGGVIGGVGGFLGGKKAKKAKKYAKRAAAIQQQREQEAYRQSLLAQIRQARISRASNLAAAVAAGTEESSGAQGTLSSIGSQTANLVEYMSVDRGRAVQVAQYSALAGKNQAAAQKTISLTQDIIDLGTSITKAYGETKTPAQPNTTQVQNVNYGEQFGPYYQYKESFGPKLNK